MDDLIERVKLQERILMLKDLQIWALQEETKTQAQLEALSNDLDTRSAEVSDAQ